MSAPFIALTLPGSGNLPPRPIFVNALQIRSVNEHWQAKDGRYPAVGPDDIHVIGTYITTGTGEEGTFSVAESYGKVIGAIRDALA